MTAEKLEYMRSRRGFPGVWGPWHILPPGEDGYSRKYWKTTCLCGANPTVHGRSDNAITTDVPPSDQKRCAKCFRLAEARERNAL